jgi:hypothetical protein
MLRFAGAWNATGPQKAHQQKPFEEARAQKSEELTEEAMLATLKPPIITGVSLYMRITSENVHTHMLYSK